MGGPENEHALSGLANDRDLAASTENQALSALLLLFGEVLGIELLAPPRVAYPFVPAMATTAACTFLSSFSAAAGSASASR